MREQFFLYFAPAISVYSSVLLGREVLTLLKLTLAGAANAALFSSLTQCFLVLNEAALDQVLYWPTAFVQGRKIEICVSYVSVYFRGLFLCDFLASKIIVLMMGEEVVKA